jgi:hypothetical protein
MDSDELADILQQQDNSNELHDYNVKNSFKQIQLKKSI